MSAPRMAAQDAPYGKIETLEGTVFTECFEGILGTCRGKPACGWLKRGYAHLIEPDEQNERKDEDLPDDGRSLYAIRLLLHSVC